MDTLPARPSAPLVRPLGVALVAASLIAGCGDGPPRPSPPEPARPRVAAPATSPDDGQLAKVSWYGKDFAGKPTASGEPFDPEDLTIAHRTLPLGTRVRLTNPENGRSVEARVNDRGPYVSGRTADLSRAAARRLGLIEDGIGEVRMQVISKP